MRARSRTVYVARLETPVVSSPLGLGLDILERRGRGETATFFLSPSFEPRGRRNKICKRHDSLQTTGLAGLVGKRKKKLL